MQALWSLAKVWFIGLGAFTTVIAAFVIATVLVVSGPPTASEASELQAASGDIFRDIRAVSSRACRRSPDGFRRLLGCNDALETAEAEATETVEPVVHREPVAAKPPPTETESVEEAAPAPRVTPTVRQGREQARRATAQRSERARPARASNTRRATAASSRTQRATTSRTQAQRAANARRQPTTRRAAVTNSRRPAAAQPPRVASQRAAPVAPPQRATQPPMTQPAVAPVLDPPRAAPNPRPEVTRSEVAEDAADPPQDDVWSQEEEEIAPPKDEDTGDQHASDDASYYPQDREWRPRRRRYRD